MRKGPTGRWVWCDAASMLIGKAIVAKCYLYYKVVCGVKAHVFDYRQYGDVKPRGLSKQARRSRYTGTLSYYGISGDKNPEVLRLLGPELAQKVKVVALPYDRVLDCVRTRLILPPSMVSVYLLTKKVPITANVCYTSGDSYYVVYDPTSEYSKFYLLHELGHVKDALQNGEWIANKFAIDNMNGGYDELKDLSSCTTELITWCEHISGKKLSKFERKIITDCSLINTYATRNCFKKYVETKDDSYLKEAEKLTS